MWAELNIGTTYCMLSPFKMHIRARVCAHYSIPK